MSTPRRRPWFFIAHHPLLTAVIAVVVTPLLLIVLGGFLPVHLTSYMLQSPTKPVDHRWVPSSQIAETARRAVVAAEDQKFWDHHGFDVEAMQKAYQGNKRGRRVRGGSTISQQTAKNLFLWPGGGYLRKGIEAGLTTVIETLWPKQRILEVYLNSAEFGPGIYGIEAAAQRYFKKSAAQLSPSEAARLAAVLPNPRKWKVLEPGPYVASRSAWIQRQMGYGGRPAPVEDAEPLPPAGELPEEYDAAPLDDPAPSGNRRVPVTGTPAGPDSSPASPDESAPTATPPAGPATTPFEDAPAEAPQPVSP